MRRAALILAASAAIISGCRDNSGIRGYWSSRELDIDNYDAAEEEFADFVELAVQAPEADANAAVDRLLKKARKDEVTYLIYADWIIRGFSSIASPCQSCGIFVHAADKVISQDIAHGETLERYRLRREVCLHNRVGDKAELPSLKDSTLAIEGRTLVLVVDQDCPSCRESMKRFDSPKWEGTSKIALCYGYGRLPEEAGWLCRRILTEQSIIDIREAPFFYVISPDGTVEISYTPVHEENNI
ncbi:MAG: DUF5106 domain-containing protein [Bacteroidales bacterium]|nr:DUF5106 domain-containing protein [Bacteroidales bacterium]